MSVPSFAISATYAASSAGFVDIPAATANATAFDIPFGAVASPKCVVIQNLAEISLTVQTNTATGASGPFTVGPSGCSMPVFAAAGSSLTALKCVTGATSVTAAQIAYVILGD